jgi:hypothetical protein
MAAAASKRAQQPAPLPVAVVDAAAMRVARRVARERLTDGALAVVLTGSHVRGDAHAESDIDLVAVYRKAADGRAGSPSVRRGGRLVVTASETVASVRAGFRSPRLLGTYVPGWRDAVILFDPEGIARRLQAMARRWSWAPVEAACDQWVADEITGFAEEVHKLTVALERHEDAKAAVQRAMIALRMASVVAIRRRMLSGTENVLWDLAGAAMGSEWARTQAVALGARPASPAEGCRAALKLYALTADDVMPLLDREQRSVVRHAVSLATGAGR